ncbi:MAG: 4Fe-4S binding protein [Oscillibacter sp.]|uniref:DUF362 domain-containing protein n=1 Tax=Oscillibacter sp. TaxID=1945593 RepID=UPI00289C4237|nr:4Fe-4S binding protein [Oscillibacter sp.]MEA4994340.1 4Fe-4S binding protein [Oscillibacter sp.]
MVVNTEKCIGCGKCTVYCPVRAISVAQRKASIDLDICTECGNCQRAAVCPKDALEKQTLEWPRQIRSQMSDVTTVYRGVNGRGTEEMKTNDITHRFKPGFAGIAVEMGRPQISSSLRDLEKMSRVLAFHGAEFEDLNPITSYIVDKKTGTLDPDILDERVISGIVEAAVPIEKLRECVEAVIAASDDIDTVFSLDVISINDKDGGNEARRILDEAGIWYRPNCKNNVGLGHLN